jgi:hypothetical protein
MDIFAKLKDINIIIGIIQGLIFIGGLIWSFLLKMDIRTILDIIIIVGLWVWEIINKSSLLAHDEKLKKKIIFRFRFVIALLILIGSELVFSYNTPDAPYTKGGITLEQMGDANYDSGKHAVVLIKDITFGGKDLGYVGIGPYSEKEAVYTIRSDGETRRTITLSDTERSLFKLGRGITLILENITLKGNKAKGALIECTSNSTLVINGAIIKGHAGTAVAGIDNATIIMGGGTISNNGECGVTITYLASFKMERGTISKNKKSGVKVSDSELNDRSPFVMKAGDIIRNKDYGVRVSPSNKFTPYGGGINKNFPGDVVYSEK